MMIFFWVCIALACMVLPVSVLLDSRRNTPRWVWMVLPIAWGFFVTLAFITLIVSTARS